MRAAADNGKCGSCGAANPAGARYCGSCGADLTPTAPCGSCGADNPAGQRFCNACGAALDEAAAAPSTAPAEPAPDGERKQVTVLFADVKGSMEMAEQTDPEEWRGIMQRFFDLLSDGVRRFEGTVDKFTGDGIMALFGAPIAHEDHAPRACFAALHIGERVAEYAAELRRSKGLSFSVRVGINSGEVVAGQLGEDDVPSYTAVGHTVGLAQRMEALAEPGKAYLTEHAAKLARGYLELKDLGEFEVKGASRPLRVYELVGPGSARSRLDVSRERGLSRFVGRSEETQVLEEALERAEAGHGAVVGIVAEPGVGKSRLCYEFAERCRARGVEVYEAQAQAHGEAIPFMPVLQMLRGYFGISERDPERVAREKIAGRLLLLDQGFSDDLPLIFDFLAVPDPERPAPQVSAEARQRLLRGVIRRLYRVPGRTDVVVNVVEDLHWLDEGSEVFLAEMVSAVEGTATLVVVNFRPEYDAAWTASPVYRRVSLLPLGPEATGELLAYLAGDDASLDGLAEAIHERTGGNPFFIEEVVRELVESGCLEGEQGAYRLARPIEEAGVPATVQAILAARIDRLASAKALLQAAAVIGTEVPEQALLRVSGLDDGELAEGLKELIGAGFLYEAEIYPERVLAFTHPLTREVAYESQLAEQRAASHAAAARALIELNPDRHDELAALVAQHLEQGGERLEAARWGARAAHWADHSQPREALRLWEKVTELAAQLPESDESIALRISSRMMQLDYAWRLGMEEERAETLFEEARELATRTGDPRSLSLLTMLGAARPGVARHADVWIAGVDEAIRLADESGDDAFRVAVRVAGSYAHLSAGRLEECERVLDEALAIAGDDAGAGAGMIITCPFAFAHYQKGMVCREQGRYEEAEQLFDAGIRIASERDDPETEGWARGNKAVLLALRGKLDEAVGLAQRNYELTERLGDAFSRSWALINLGFVLAAHGDGAAGVDAIERGDEVLLEATNERGEAEAWREAAHAYALLAAGRVPDAIEAAEHSSRVARERGMLLPLPQALLTLARARMAAGEPGAAEALAEGAAAARKLGTMAVLEQIEELRDSLEVKPAP